MKRWLLLLIILFGSTIITPASAQDNQECSPDLTQVNLLLIEAQQALNEDDIDTALEKMTEADDALVAEIESCQPIGESSDEFVFFDPENIDTLLLTIDDFPSGWSLESFEEDEGSSETSTVFCSELPSTNIPNREVRFSRGQVGPFLFQTTGIFPTVDEAEERFQSIQAIAEDCDTWTVANDEGDEMTYTLLPLSSPDFGDQSMAFRLTLDNGQGDITYVRAANIMFIFVHLTTIFGDPIDPDLTENLVELTLDRMQ